MAAKLSKEILTRIAQVTNRRARLVLDTIAKKGSITTEQLKELGYDHAPRAARDVRELGFTLVTTMVKNDSGKRMAQYSLSEGVEAGKTGRLQLPKKRRDEIIQASSGKCQICGATHDLQVDHRVPYQVAGETLKGTVDPYMVLDGTCNRRKSWICEHCPNLLKDKKVEICQSCYWANPEEHTHVATEELRRIDVVFSGGKTKAFDKFRKSANRQQQSVPDRVREIIEESGK
jgi:hypothetical protein